MEQGGARVSRKSEREAAARANEILRAAHGRGEDVGGDYGAGRMTRSQKKSQATHIGWTPGPQTAGQKLKRAWFG